MRIPALGLAVALALGGVAVAQPAAPPASDAPTVTAPAATAPSVADQIDAFIKATPVPDVTREAAPGVTSSTDPQPRKIHGVVEVGVGTGGYRHAYVEADIPVGQTGTLSVAVDQTQFNGRSGRYGRGWGGGPQSLSTLSIGGAWGSQTLAGSCRLRQFDEVNPAPYPSVMGVRGPDGFCRPAPLGAP